MRIDGPVRLTLQEWFADLEWDSVRIVTRGPVCWFVAKVLRQGALTFEPFIFFGKATFESSSLRSLALLAHELRHIEQYRRMGRVKFLLRYYWDRARHGFRYRRDLPLEAEAYALQAEVLRVLQARSAGNNSPT